MSLVSYNARVISDGIAPTTGNLTQLDAFRDNLELLDDKVALLKSAIEGADASLYSTTKEFVCIMDATDDIIYYNAEGEETLCNAGLAVWETWPPDRSESGIDDVWGDAETYLEETAWPAIWATLYGSAEERMMDAGIYTEGDLEKFMDTFMAAMKGNCYTGPDDDRDGLDKLFADGLDTGFGGLVSDAEVRAGEIFRALVGLSDAAGLWIVYWQQYEDTMMETLGITDHTTWVDTYLGGVDVTAKAIATLFESMEIPGEPNFWAVSAVCMPYYVEWAGPESVYTNAKDSWGLIEGVLEDLMSANRFPIWEPTKEEVEGHEAASGEREASGYEKEGF